MTQTRTSHKWNCGGNLEGKNVINQNETFFEISCDTYSEFHLKDRPGWHNFPHSRVHLATELASWLNHFYITGTTSSDVCPPFPAPVLASSLVKQPCQLVSSIVRWVHFLPDHINWFYFAIKQRRSTPVPTQVSIQRCQLIDRPVSCWSILKSHCTEERIQMPCLVVPFLSLLILHRTLCLEMAAWLHNAVKRNLKRQFAEHLWWQDVYRTWKDKSVIDF